MSSVAMRNDAGHQTHFRAIVPALPHGPFKAPREPMTTLFEGRKQRDDALSDCARGGLQEVSCVQRLSVEGRRRRLQEGRSVARGAGACGNQAWGEIAQAGHERTRMSRRAGLSWGGLIFIPFLAAGVAGCGPDKITPIPTATPAGTADAGRACSPSLVCAPGATQLCYCPDTSQRGQVCASDGQFWEPCPCPGVNRDASGDP